MVAVIIQLRNTDILLRRTEKWELASDDEKKNQVLHEAQDLEEPALVKSPSEAEAPPEADGSSPEPSEDGDYVDDYRLAKLNQRKVLLIN